MNTMELVREVERAQPRSTSSRKATPLFPSELIGPVRHAILRARQFLLSEQQENGSWLGARTSDASLPSQLIFLLAYLGEEQGELAQQAAAAIREAQQPCGGWSLVPSGPPDVSTSVQAYFALKLSGVEPGDERLCRARAVIRRLGGADAADSSTRFFLALFGQIDYDCCPALPPEWLSFTEGRLGLRVPLSAVWSHRPVRDVGIERGARELFINKPCDWPAHLPASDRRWPRLNAVIRSVLGWTFRQCERRGWTPLRRRGLERAESRLLEQIRAERLERLDFFELVWHAIAIRTIGYADESAEVRACEKRLHEMIAIDEDGDAAKPRLCTSPFSDTAIVLRGLRASGVPFDHPAVRRACNWFCQPRCFEAPLEPADLSNAILIFAAESDSERAVHEALPPAIGLSDSHRFEVAGRHGSEPRLRQLERLSAALRERLRAHLRSAPKVPAAILESIAADASENSSAQIHRAVECLRAAQAADGSWANITGSGSIEATSLAIRGLAAAGVSKDDPAIAAGANWLIVHQQPSGGWGEAPQQELARSSGPIAESVRHEIQGQCGCPPTASHTAFVLVALAAAGKANQAAARRAVQFLIETQEEDGRWSEPHFVVRDDATGRWCSNDLHSVAWPLLALSRWAVAAAADPQNTDGSISLRLVNGSAGNYDCS